MNRKYVHLLSPLQIGDVILRNRIILTPSQPLFIQGSEPYPTEAFIVHCVNKAKGGAALVTVDGGMIFGPPISIRGLSEVEGHRMRFDVYDSQVQNYLSTLTEAVHFYGSKISVQMAAPVPEGYDVSPGMPPAMDIGPPQPRKAHNPFPCYGVETPPDILNEVADEMENLAYIMKSCGFDGVYIHMAYAATFLGRFLSPRTNKRTDQYGGSIENRARYPLMICERIKQRCGKNFLIEASITGYDPPYWSLEDTVKFAKMAEGRIDMLQLRPWDIDLTHPTGFEQSPTPWVFMAEALKKSEVKILVVATSGFTHPDLCEEAIASGKADLIAMARAWISNPDFGSKIYEGRVDDIVPCIRCNKCHRSSPSDPWISVCSVNPTWGMEHLIDRFVKPSTTKRKVAVVGGGPAGMEAAIVAAERGHEVTLYEKSESLGGLLKTADYASFKWPLREFKNYLIRKVKKAGVELQLKTEATPKTLMDREYEAVIIAIGAEPIKPPIPCVEGENVMNAVDVYGKEDRVAEEAVIIGGGEVGVETGIHLAQKGRRVVILEMLDRLAADACPVHYRRMLLMALDKQENVKYMLNASCTGIYDNGVIFTDKEGIEHKLEAGTVVLSVGMKPKTFEAVKIAKGLTEAGIKFHMIGDCAQTRGNVQKAIRSAFAAAVSL